MARSQTREWTDDPETMGGAFGPGKTEIFFGLRTGRFSALDDSTSKTVSLEPGTAGSHTISSCSSSKVDVEGIGVGGRSIERHVRG